MTNRLAVLSNMMSLCYQNTVSIYNRAASRANHSAQVAEVAITIHSSQHDAHSNVIPWLHWNLDEGFWHGSSAFSGIANILNSKSWTNALHAYRMLVAVLRDLLKDDHRIPGKGT